MALDPNAHPVVGLEAIRSGAREEAQGISTAASATALKEDEELFEKALRKKLLGSVRVLIDVFVILFCIVLAVRVYHLLMPERLSWLLPPQIDAVDQLLKSGLLVTLGGIGKDLVVNSLPKKK